MNEKKGIAHVRLETDMDETHKTADDISAPSCIASQSIEAIDRRVTEEANYCSQMFVSMDRSLDRITDRLALLEDRLNEINVYLSRLNTRIVRLETDELNAIDERLCRLESPPALEIDPRATAKPSKTPAAVTIPIRVFECCACGTGTPCMLSVDGPSVRPDHCPYTGHRATWQVAGVPK